MTIPHKQSVIVFCDEVDAVAERAGSVNTLVIADGRILGSSTDGLAVTAQLSPDGLRALVLGTGGAAKAVAAALAHAGAEVSRSLAAETRTGRPRARASTCSSTRHP